MLDPMQVESEKTWGKEAWGQHTCGISFVLHRNGNGIRADDACCAHAVQCLVTQDESCFRHLGCYDLQDTNSEDCANSHPLHDGQMQLPHFLQWQQQYRNISDNIDDCIGIPKCISVVALHTRDLAVPETCYGIALENG
jgi:hypothetical protein